MLNVTTKMSKDNKKLVIEIDMTQEHGLSKSGKTIIVGSTQGNVQVGNGIMLGLNAYKYPQR